MKVECTKLYGDPPSLRELDLVAEAKRRTAPGRLLDRAPAPVLVPCSTCSASGYVAAGIRCRPCGGSGER